MAVTFGQVKLHDVVDLPGRRGAPDRYKVIWKHNDRLKLESMLQEGQMKYLTSNQFNDAGFERAYAGMEQEDGE